MKPPLPVAILAGGLATRLHPITETIPKSLVEVAGEPFIAHQLELLRASGITEVVLCVGHFGEMIEQEIGDGHAYGLHVQYSFDGPQLLGTGGALRRALPYLGEAFLVLYGDSYLECDYMAIAQSWIESDKLGLMTVLRNDGRWDQSNVIFRAGRIVRYDKHESNSEMRYVDYGLGGFRATVFDEYAPETVLDMATIYQSLVARDQLAGYQVERRFYEIGSVTGLNDTRAYLTSKRR